MGIVSSRRLKARLSERIRLVRRKGPVLVCNRGEIVAELRAPCGAMARGDLAARRADSAARFYPVTPTGCQVRGSPH